MRVDKVFLLFYGEDMKSFLSAAETAKLLDVDRATITRWIRKGVIKGAQRPAGTKRWRVPITVYEELIRKNV